MQTTTASNTSSSGAPRSLMGEPLAVENGGSAALMPVDPDGAAWSAAAQGGIHEGRGDGWATLREMGQQQSEQQRAAQWRPEALNANAMQSEPATVADAVEISNQNNQQKSADESACKAPASPQFGAPTHVERDPCEPVRAEVPVSTDQGLRKANTQASPKTRERPQPTGKKQDTAEAVPTNPPGPPDAKPGRIERATALVKKTADEGASAVRGGLKDAAGLNKGSDKLGGGAAAAEAIDHGSRLGGVSVKFGARVTVGVPAAKQSETVALEKEWKVGTPCDSAKGEKGVLDFVSRGLSKLKLEKKMSEAGMEAKGRVGVSASGDLVCLAPETLVKGAAGALVHAVENSPLVETAKKSVTAIEDRLKANGE